MWSSILPLLLFVALGIVILIIFEVRARKQQRANSEPSERPVTNSEASNSREEASNPDDGCCGEHLVCERETLLQTNAKVEYYDDEELDALSGIPAEDYTEEQYQMIREVFNTLQAKDVPGWVRSIQLRNIQLPLDIREEALLIVVERRKA
ncbi:MAG: phospholipase [Paludibacteraceae bacterium]|nr:phospholipase [Paludibacteraceae bacterium]